MALNELTEKRVIHAIAINYGIYLLMRLFFYTTYESQLDVMVQAGINGISGVETGYILYSNVILGWLLKGLTTILPVLNWYYMYLCGSVIIALSLVSYVILKRTPNVFGYTLVMVFSCFTGYECYVLPGSMKTAAVLGVTALVILADYVESGVLTRRKRECLIVILAVLGSMTSFSAFWIAGAVGLSGMVLYYSIQREDEIRAWLKKEAPMHGSVRYTALLLLCILAASVLFQAADAAIYHAGGRENALKYRSSMVWMYGYGMGEYEEVYREKYGMDNVKYAALQNGSFGLMREDSWEELAQIAREGRGISGEKINFYFKKVPLALFKYGIFYLFIVMLYMLFSSKMEKKKLFLWMELVLLAVSFLIAYILQAWANNWVVFVLIVPLTIPILLSLKGADENNYKYLWAFLIVLSVILYTKFSPGMVSSVPEERMSDKLLNTNSNQVNLIDLNAYLKSFSASDVYVKGVLAASNVKISNGAYALIEGFDGNVMTEPLPEETQCQWLYNPKNIDARGILIADVPYLRKP